MGCSIPSTAGQSARDEFKRQVREAIELRVREDISPDATIDTLNIDFSTGRVDVTVSIPMCFDITVPL
jgi:hypothetical protein